MYIEYLNSNWWRFQKIPDNEERLKFTQIWMKNMTKWSNSEFNRQFAVNNLDEGWSIPDEPEDQFIDIICDTEREDLKVWLIDLNRNFSQNQVDKLLRLRGLYLRLETHEKVLWDLYFTQMLSLRDIGKKIDLPHMSVWSMINELKKKVKLWMQEELSD